MKLSVKVFSRIFFHSLKYVLFLFIVVFFCDYLRFVYRLRTIDYCAAFDCDCLATGNPVLTIDGTSAQFLRHRVGELPSTPTTNDRVSSS